LEGKKCDIVTSIAMFYDLENPIAFTQGIRNVLSPEGIWIFEMSYMPTMLSMTSYDTICHEHLEYYSLAIIEYILKQAGMRVFNVSENPINGGSLRCYASRADNFHYKKAEWSDNISAMRQKEFTLELDTNKPYKNFQDRINVHKEELTSLLKKLKQQGKKIHVYGASTKGNTLLQWCGIDNRIVDCAAERNPDKYGASTLGTEIPIVSEAESRAMNPDYYLVLPWHFKEEFIDFLIKYEIDYDELIEPLRFRFALDRRSFWSITRKFWRAENQTSSARLIHAPTEVANASPTWA